ncbi:glycosyl transferase family 2 [Krasilnikovia cinnamomea]|uniref:Glycosyl transferase family 2 n=1 Tax=Krasilnikovia cinnamomea TaxID=349313 RepID=A0A4Q7ZHX6_9ACTN|nr:glycosyltransferase [Krasilnikovia cinnamomea]RZU50442.1 glycosyl transferase family 2 [Krasilnikovia cinnamomea]
MPVSVIVTASGTADEFQKFLDGLRPTLGLRDEVVCVLPPRRPDLAAKTRAQSWLTVVDDASPEQGARWSAGLSATNHPIAVLLDGDTLLTPNWLDAVAAAFDDPTVVAAGPRCFRTFGPQRVGLPPEALASVTKFKAYARQWRQDNRGLTEVDRLGPVCVAVRREALARVGGPTLDMPYEKLREHGRLLLVESALIAHFGGRQCALVPAPPIDAPLLSACLITKDEEAVIAECLSALRDAADEIVVYDTGSTDRTREIAREHGAHVVDGYWDDHFGDARNRSIAHSRGQWSFTVDADEVVQGDVTALRHQLATAERTVDGFLVPQVSQTATGNVTVQSTRLFRAHENRYRGRLHEHVVHRITGEIPETRPIDGLALLHSGYLETSFATKDKVGRNARLAELARDEGPEALFNLARSVSKAGDPEAAIEACRSGLAAHPDSFIRTGLLYTLIRCCAQTGRLDEASAALSDLRKVAREPVTVDEAEIVIRATEGDHERVLEILRGMPETATNDFGMAAGRREMAPNEVASLRATGRAAEAAEILRPALRAGRLLLPLEVMSTVLDEAGSDLTELVRLIPEPAVREVLYSTRTASPELADAVIEALWQRFPGDPRIFGVVVWLADRLPLNRAIEWSRRLREQDLAKYCPLLATATSTERPAVQRALAAAAALEFFGDQAALAPLAEALDQVPDEQTSAVLEELRALAPGVASAIEMV